MRKSVGYRRDIKAVWFDDAAALRVSTSDVNELRRRLDDLLSREIHGDENRAITVQILLRIWAKPESSFAALHKEAVDRFAMVERPSDRIWLHYGLCLLTYPFFRDSVAQAGLLLRRRDVLSNSALKQRIIADIGQLGSLENASRAVMFILRQWAFIVPASGRGLYQVGSLSSTEDREIEMWLVKAALHAHQSDGLPVTDLLGWSALFPFHISLTADDLRRIPYLELQRHGGNIDIIRAVQQTVDVKA